MSEKFMFECPSGHDSKFVYEFVTYPDDTRKSGQRIMCLMCGRVFEVTAQTVDLVDWVNQIVVARNTLTEVHEVVDWEVRHTSAMAGLPQPELWHGSELKIKVVQE